MELRPQALPGRQLRGKDLGSEGQRDQVILWALKSFQLARFAKFLRLL